MAMIDDMKDKAKKAMGEPDTKTKLEEFTKEKSNSMKEAKEKIQHRSEAAQENQE